MLFKRDPRSLSLTTERLVIRLPQRGDEGAIARYYEENQAFLQPWAPSLDETYFDARAWRERIDAIISEFKHGRGARLIFLPYDESHEVLGMASLTNITGFPSYSCQLGYSMSANSEGRGLMTEALRAILSYTFGELQLHRIEANYIRRNRKSGRVLEKLGFRIEGESKAYLLINGAWEDHIRTALLAEEWKEKAPSGNTRS